MKIFLYRHGETQFNVEERFQGHVDSSLTENGVLQAKRNADYLKGKKICVIFSSPFERAKKTAGFLWKHFPKTQYFEVDALKEINNGEADGLLIEECKKKYPHLIARANLEDLHSAFPGGESYKDVTARLLPFVEKLKQEYRGKNVAIVGHGGVNRMLIGILLSLPYEKLVKVAIPTNVIYEIILSEKATKVFYIKNKERKKGLVFKNNKHT